MRRVHPIIAIAVAAILGCSAFVALLPWGDPCSLTTPPGEAGCTVLFSPLQQDLHNVVFLAICLLIGLIAGVLTRSHRLLAGALGVFLGFWLAFFAAHWIYGIGFIHHPLWTTSTALIGIALLGLSALLGLAGAVLSSYVRLTNAWSGRDT
jgi:hypothetical protein